MSGSKCSCSHVICLRVKLRHKHTGVVLLAVSTHLDHQGKHCIFLAVWLKKHCTGSRARVESAALLLEQLSKLGAREMPVLLMGDFNSYMHQVALDFGGSAPVHSFHVDLTGSIPSDHFTKVFGTRDCITKEECEQQF